MAMKTLQRCSDKNIFSDNLSSDPPPAELVRLSIFSKKNPYIISLFVIPLGLEIIMFFGNLNIGYNIYVSIIYVKETLLWFES